MARILVIDDQEAIRRLVRRTLEQQGHELLDASDGAMGVQLLQLHPVDVVITDVFMPGQDGFQTLRQIRKDFPAVQVLMMTGGDSAVQLDFRFREGAELLGAVRTLQKPFTARELIDAVRAVTG